MFRTVFSCKWCLICAYFSPDSDSDLSRCNVLKLKPGAFHFTKCWRWLTRILMDHFDVFISCLDSHSDGTHSLHRIHWRASDLTLHFFVSLFTRKPSYSLIRRCLTDSFPEPGSRPKSWSTTFFWKFWKWKQRCINVYDDFWRYIVSELPVNLKISSGHALRFVHFHGTMFSFSQCFAIVFLFKTLNSNNVMKISWGFFLVSVDVICACPLLQVRQVWYWLAYFALDTFDIWSHSVLILGLTSVPGKNSRVSTYVCWCIGMCVQLNLTLNSRSLSIFALMALRWTASSATWLFHCLSFSFQRHKYNHTACSLFS